MSREQEVMKETSAATDLAAKVVCQTSVGIEDGEVGAANVTDTQLLVT